MTCFHKRVFTYYIPDNIEARMKLISELLGGWENFSEWELRGLLSAYGGRISERHSKYIEFETEFPGEITNRITFSKRVSKILDDEDMISRRYEKVKFAVRERRNEGRESLIHAVAKTIKGKVDLENPDVIFFVYNYERPIISELIYERDVSRLLDRRYNARPMNHPSSISPLLARGMLNIAGLREGENFLDPFSGTGTFLIEGFRMGLNGFGIDRNSKMVSGGNDNLQYFNFPRNIVQGDFSKMRDYRNIRTVVTDPPYGRGSKVFSDSRKSLYADFFAILADLKWKGSVFCLPSNELVELGKNYLNLSIAAEIRVHSSLTRSIVVIL